MIKLMFIWLKHGHKFIYLSLKIILRYLVLNLKKYNYLYILNEYIIEFGNITIYNIYNFFNSIIIVYKKWGYGMKRV
jgi:hypothetical protein